MTQSSGEVLEGGVDGDINQTVDFATGDQIVLFVFIESLIRLIS